MAEIVWNVQPYQHISDMANNYTLAVISTTIYEADRLSQEAETWMRQNAPWKDRSEAKRERARELGYIVPDRHAREALSVQPVVNKNTERHYQALMRQAHRADLDKASKTGKPNTHVQARKTQREINNMRGPLMEIRFSHGEDIWYGLWLEVANQGRYNIIARAVDYWSPIFLREIKRIANLKQFSHISFGEGVTPLQQFNQRVLEKDLEYLEQGSDVFYQPWTAEQQARMRSGRSAYQRRVRKERAEEYKSLKEVERIRKEATPSRAASPALPPDVQTFDPTQFSNIPRTSWERRRR